MVGVLGWEGGIEGPMSLEDSDLGLTLVISLAQHFLWGCGEF